MRRRSYQRTLANETPAQGRGFVAEATTLDRVVGAEGETRTLTGLLPPPPQDGVSANSTTSACLLRVGRPCAVATSARPLACEGSSRSRGGQQIWRPPHGTVVRRAVSRICPGPLRGGATAQGRLRGLAGSAQVSCSLMCACRKRPPRLHSGLYATHFGREPFPRCGIVVTVRCEVAPEIPSRLHGKAKTPRHRSNAQVHGGRGRRLRGA